VVLPTGPWFEGLRNGSFDVAIEGNYQSVINPVLDECGLTPNRANLRSAARSALVVDRSL
jgi:hypothetical protein